MIAPFDRLGLRFAALSTRLRQNLFVIPGSCLVLGAVLSEVTLELDRSGVADWLPGRLETSGDNARTVLGAIATGTVTVVTLVLTLTLVAIQLAAGQLSPRTIADFLGDRFQQATVGVVLGTATFSLFALRSVQVATEDTTFATPDVTALTAVILTMATLLMLVSSVHRIANRLAVGKLVSDIASETCALVERRYGVAPTAAGESPGRLVGKTGHSERPVALTSRRSGWVQYIDESALVAGFGSGTTIEICHPVGTFVLDGMALLRGDRDPLATDDQGLRDAIVIGDHRTMQQDVSFGLTRLTDIGLRALSPGVNDPNTAREVILRSSQVVLALLEYELDPPEVEIEGRTVVRAGAPSHDEFVRDAFEQLREAAARDRATLLTLERSLDVLAGEADRRSLPGSVSEIARQREKAAEALGDLTDDGHGASVGAAAHATLP